MARPVFLLISALQTLFIFTNAETDPGGLINPRDDTRIILEKLNSNPTAMKVYKSVDLIYSEFKASTRVCVNHIVDFYSFNFLRLPQAGPHLIK